MKPIIIIFLAASLSAVTIKTAGAPSWTNWTSMRAGFPNQLDGTTGSPSTCFWQVLSGPSPLGFNNRTSCTPTTTPPIFGTYTFQLTTTGGSAPGTTTQQIGAVATDANGVVVQADPNADAIY